MSTEICLCLLDILTDQFCLELVQALLAPRQEVAHKLRPHIVCERLWVRLVDMIQIGLKNVVSPQPNHVRCAGT